MVTHTSFISIKLNISPVINNDKLIPEILISLVIINEKLRFIFFDFFFGLLAGELGCAGAFSYSLPVGGARLCSCLASKLGKLLPILSENEKATAEYIDGCSC